MKDQLDKEEIGYLFQFVQRKYVRWVDVQFEIVDHLASAIEDQMKTDPNLTFDNALNRVYSKFPITGFAQMVIEKERALNRFWIKKLLGFMIQYLKFPRIILTAGLTYILYTILNTGGQIGIWSVYGFMMLMTIGKMIYIHANLYPDKNLYDKYLVTNTYLGFANVYDVGAIITPLYIFDDFTFTTAMSNTSIWILAVYCALVTLWSYAEVTAFPEMLRKELHQKYQHLGIVIPA